MTKIIFKFDDFSGPTRNARKVDRFIRLFRIKVTWGIIGRCMADWSEKDRFWVRRARASRLYYFWNHGWTHEMDEFRDLSVIEATAHLRKTQRTARDVLGITLDAFGAPCNALNVSTVEAVQSVPEIRYWFYGDPKFAGVNFVRELELEYPLFHPSLLKFVRACRRGRPKAACLVLQGHPNGWTWFGRLNFYLIVLYLKLKGCQFAFPAEV